jgi:DNA-binding NarL/FixJ family response regulator
MSIRIVLADDHGIVRDGVHAVLDREPELEVIGKVSDGRQAARLCREQVPDIVVMDLTMPDMSGVEATRLITAEQPTVKVLCLSMHADRGFVMAALEAGAAGYVLKDGIKIDLLNAIRTVMQDQVYLSPAIAGMVVDAATSMTTTSVVPVFASLSAREREVLGLLAGGESTKEIAQRLNLSVKTVGTHRRHIMDKLNINSIATLTKLAIREGLTSAAERLLPDCTLARASSLSPSDQVFGPRSQQKPY